MLRWRLLALAALAAAVYAGGAAALVLIVGLSALVAAHEGGHWFVARRLGIEPAEFAVGMGPLVARRGRFSLRLLPLGGYVRFADEKALEAATPGRRVAVAAAGPVASIAAGFVMMLVAFVAIGFPVRTGAVTEAVTGLQLGDAVVSVDGAPLPGAVAFGEQHEVVVARADGTEAVAVVDGDDLRAALEVRTGRLGLVESLNRAAEATGGTVVATGRAILGIPAALVASLGGPDSTDATVGTASQVTSEIDQIGRALGAGGVLLLLAFLSISVGVFNALPFPPLDGGHMLVGAVEGVGSRLARRRVTIPARAVAACTAVVASVLVAMLALSVLLDVGRLF